MRTKSMHFRKIAFAAVALALAAAPVAAQATGTERHDARCAFVKSTVLGQLLEADRPDQAVISGVTAHLLYYIGRLEAVLDRPEISDLIFAEAQEIGTVDELIAAEEACDAPMQGTIDFMTSVGNRLSAAGN